MRSNAGMATRRRDVDLRFTQVAALRTLAWLGLEYSTFPSILRFTHIRTSPISGAIKVNIVHYVKLKCLFAGNVHWNHHRLSSLGTTIVMPNQIHVNYFAVMELNVVTNWATESKYQGTVP